MRGFKQILIGGIAALTAIGSGAAQAQDISAEFFADGFTRPVYLTHAPGDFDRVFVVEQRSGTTGRIRVVDRATGAINTTPFVSVTGVSTGNEQGLLGMAFHPDYQTNGKFYVNFTQSNGDTVIREYTVSANPDIADATSAKTIIVIDQPFSNHNGGWIDFSPIDEYLYIGMGDGGSGNDPGNRAQDITDSLLGAMLRIDVNGDDFPADANRNYAIPPSNPFVGVTGDDEIWAYGLRNPYRNSFDRETGDLWIGDVGQSTREEIDVQPFNSVGGENYGWRCLEGTFCTGNGGCSCTNPALVGPFYEYGRSGGQCSVISGYRYRGCTIPELVGTYFFADYCSTMILSVVPNATLDNFTNLTSRTTQLEPPGTDTIGLLTSFGEDAYGEMYIVDQGGDIYKIVPTDTTPRVDCNNNGIEDACELLDGSGDLDGNGIIDICDQDFCRADFDGDGEVNLGDFGIFGAAFGSNPSLSNWNPNADFDGDGDVDLGDFGVFGGEFGRTDCPMVP